jgi:hypothetical protein
MAKTRPGADPQGRRTILCDNDPTFVLYRVAQRFGLPVVPEWAPWFNQELARHRMIQGIEGLGCSPVLIRGSKKVFLKWIGRALRRRQIAFPEGNGPVCWSLANSFFPFGEDNQGERCCQELSEEIPATQAEGEETESCESS